MYIYISIHISIYQYMYLSQSIYINLSIFLNIHRSILVQIFVRSTISGCTLTRHGLPIYPSIYLSIYLGLDICEKHDIWLHIDAAWSSYLSIYLSIYLSWFRYLREARYLAAHWRGVGRRAAHVLPLQAHRLRRNTKVSYKDR